MRGRTAVSNRADIVNEYHKSLALDGNAARGCESFRKVCCACHQLDGVGTAVSADLHAIRDRGKDAIMLNILDPNREVKPQFLTYVVTTADGRVESGMIAEETTNHLSLRRADGTQVAILRGDIDEIRNTALSYMT